MPEPILPVADAWFHVEDAGCGVHLITEPYCHRLVRANCFLVKGRDRDMLVDSGMGIGALRQALAPLLDKPLLVVATHTHLDHIGSHYEFADGEILVHSLEAEGLRHPGPTEGLGFDLFTPALRSDLAKAGFATDGLLIDALPWPGYVPSRYRLRGVTPTRLIGEGTELDLGDRHFSVLHLPGHSPGGIGLWEERQGILFAGDTLYDGMLLDTLPGADIPDYVRSMARLMDLPARTVHGGHRPSFGRDRMTVLIQDYLRTRSS